MFELTGRSQPAGESPLKTYQRLLCELYANSEDPDNTPKIASSYQVLHCFCLYRMFTKVKNTTQQFLKQKIG